MMNFIKSYAGVVALVILAIIGLVQFMGGSAKPFGSTACSGITCLSGGLRLVTDAGGDFEADVASIFSGTVTLKSTFKLGTNGTTQSNQVVTNCSMVSDASIGATSTGYAYCTGVTGVTSSDIIIAQFATSTLGFAITDQWAIVTAKASSTAGAIDFQVLNLTGAARALSAASRTGSTTSIQASH